MAYLDFLEDEGLMKQMDRLFGNDQVPVNTEEHFKRLVIVILQMLEMGLSRSAAELMTQDLKVLLDAASRIREFKNIARERDEENDILDLGDIGGEALYREIALEVREWIFIYESSEVRKVRERTKEKSDSSQDEKYLSEVYNIIVDSLKRACIGMKRQCGKLEDDQIKFSMYRYYLETEKFVKPKVKPEVLVKRCKKDFENYTHRIEDIYNKLGTFKRSIRLFSLEIIDEYGVQGIRDNWRDKQMLMERVRLEYLGLPDKQDAVLRDGFKKKVQKAAEKGENSDEEVLYSYLKLINEFVCTMAKSPDYGDTPEMRVALHAYLFPDKDEDGDAEGLDGKELDSSDFITS